VIRPARIAAVGLLVALVGGAFAVGGASGPQQVASPSTAVPRPSTEVTPTITIGSTTVTTPAAATSTSAPVTGERDVLSVVEEAMAAWGRFAVSGDLDEVEPFFAVDGPQYRLFVEEAVALAVAPPGPPPYRVSVETSDLVGDAAEARVEARVRFIRTGEPSQSFRWVIVVRRVGDDWKVWSVVGVDKGADP
jgi:hypothetical protein